jgi:hypothetical protein
VGCLLLLVPALFATLHATAEMCYLGTVSPHLLAQLGIGVVLGTLCVLAPLMACNWHVYGQPTRAWAWITTPVVASLVIGFGLLVASQQPAISPSSGSTIQVALPATAQ